MGECWSWGCRWSKLEGQKLEVQEWDAYNLHCGGGATMFMGPAHDNGSG